MNEYLTEHTRVDNGQDNIDPGMPFTAGPTVLKSAVPAAAAAGKVACDACPVLCHISEGRTGACDRWGNVNGVLTRVDPLLLSQHPSESGTDGAIFLTAVGSGTTY